jgi:hypothetical protein
MPYGAPPYGRHRYRNPIQHHQFGIYKRLRWRYGLIPKPKYKPNTPSNDMESSSTSTFIPKTRQDRQQEKLVKVLFEFLQQNPKVSGLVMSDDKQSSEDLAQQLNEISTPPIRCTAEAEAQEDYVEKLYELLSEHCLKQATWEFRVRSDQREFHQAFIAAINLRHKLHFHRPPGAKMVGS